MELTQLKEEGLGLYGLYGSMFTAFVYLFNDFLNYLTIMEIFPY